MARRPITQTLPEPAERRYRDLLEALPDAYLAFDDSGRICEWSRQAQEMFGWTAEQVVGALPEALALPEEYRSGPTPGLPCCIRIVGRRGRTGWLEYQAVRRDGQEFPVEISVVSGRAGSDEGLHLALVRDISHRVLGEERLSQAAKMEAVGQLASGLAHDFNNILGIIFGSLETLATGLKDPGDRELVNLAILASERALEVTRSMQAVARRRPLKPQVVDLNQAIHELEPLLRRSLNERIDLLIAAEAAEAEAVIEISGFNNVLLNFVINARDAMPRGGTVMIYTQNVEITAENSPDAIDIDPGRYIVVGVDDSGVGMTPEVRARALEPFFTTKPKDKGTGLGLAMAYAFARQSGGVLRLRSAPGKGTNLHLFIPRPAAVPSPAQHGKDSRRD